MQQVVRHRTSHALMVVAGLCTSLALGDEPEWVRKRPIIPDFYVGIGTSQKTRPTAEYVEGAKSVALRDIASQITVSVSSDVLRRVLEKNAQLEEEFESRVRASTTADLEGVQLVDTYETDDEYWVYCRLSKADYAARRAEKIAAATAQSLDLYTSGKRNEQQQMVGQALGLYAQAFTPIEKYLGEPLLVQSEGREVYLVNEVYGSLHTLLSRIEVKAAIGEHDATIGRPLKKPLELTAVLRDSASTPAADLPFTFRFTRGSGECLDRVRTDARGVARCEVQKVTASDRIQLVEANLDLLTLAGGDRTPPVVRTVLGSCTLPGTRFVLTVSGVNVFVDSRESLFGEPLQQKRIEPVVKSELAAKNFSFVEEKSKASLLITITADVRKGTESFGLAFAFASATVSVLDLETAQELYKSSLSDIKEGSDTFEKAAYKALNTLSARIVRDMLPHLVDKVQK